MAPLTAAVFILTTLGFLGAGPSFASRRRVRYVAVLAALAGLLIAGIVVLAYIAGTPLGYMKGSVPMAWLTATAFLLINTGILLENEAAGFLRESWSDGQNTGQNGPVARSYGQMLVLVMVAVSILSALAAFYHLREERTVVRRNVEQQLEAVVNLKVGQVQLWLAERLSDSRSLATLPDLVEWIGTLPPAAAGAGPVRREMADYLATLRKAYGYRQIVVWDRNLARYLSTARTRPRPCACPTLCAQ
jgi:hypothetical protein